MARIMEIARRMQAAEVWEGADCAAICNAAGLGVEYARADGETFERVIFHAADILGVSVL